MGQMVKLAADLEFDLHGIVVSDGRWLITISRLRLSFNLYWYSGLVPLKIYFLNTCNDMFC